MRRVFFTVDLIEFIDMQRFAHKSKFVGRL